MEHRASTQDPHRPKCVKKFSKITSQNYGIISDELFFEYLEKFPKVCCKRCAALPK